VVGEENCGSGIYLKKSDYSFGLLLKTKYILGKFCKGKVGLDPTSAICAPGMQRQ
jgi:hypothetical protein